MRKTLSTAALLALAFAASPALAQSPCSLIQPGKVLTNAQWQQCFEGKQDFGSGAGGTGAITGAQVVAALTYTPANKAGDTFTGEVITKASAAAGAGFNIPQGAAPTSPQNGDVWITSTGLFYRSNGTTVGPITTPGAGFATLGSANTFTAANTFQQVNVAYRTVNSNTTLSLTDHAVCVDVSGGSVTVTLPPNPIPLGWTLAVKDCTRSASPTKVMTVAANTGQTIEGAASQAVTTTGTALSGVWRLSATNLDLF